MSKEQELFRLIDEGYINEYDLRSLIDSGLDINAQDRDGKTALQKVVDMHYCDFRSVEICKLLIRNGAEIHSTPFTPAYLQPPFEIAVTRGHHQILEVMLESMVTAGVPHLVMHHNDLIRRAFHDAARDGKHEICAAILKYSNDQFNELQLTPTDMEMACVDACMLGRHQVLEVLLNITDIADSVFTSGSDILSRISTNPQNFLLLLKTAYKSGNQEVILRLSEYYTDADYLNVVSQMVKETGYSTMSSMQETLEFFIARKDEEEDAEVVIQLILDHAEDINYNDAFVTAMMNGELSIAKQIFGYEVDLNAKVGYLTVWQHIKVIGVINTELYDAVHQVLQDQAARNYTEYSNSYSLKLANMLEHLEGMKDVMTDTTMPLEQNHEMVSTMGDDSSCAGAGFSAYPDPSL